MSWHDYFHDDVKFLRERLRTSFVPKDKDMDKTGERPNPERGKEAPLRFHSDTRHI